MFLKLCLLSLENLSKEKKFKDNFFNIALIINCHCYYLYYILHVYNLGKSQIIFAAKRHDLGQISFHQKYLPKFQVLSKAKVSQ